MVAPNFSHKFIDGPSQKFIYGHPQIIHGCALVQLFGHALKLSHSGAGGGHRLAAGMSARRATDGGVWWGCRGQCGECSSVRGSAGSWLGLLLLPAFVLCRSCGVILLIRSAALHPGTRTSQVSGRGCGTAPSGPAPQSWELPASQPLCKWLGLILGLNTWPVPSRPPKKGLVVERPNVCGLAATISPCWMKWKSCVVCGCSFCSVSDLKPQGCFLNACSL